jgi:hypothetical protein
MKNPLASLLAGRSSLIDRNQLKNDIFTQQIKIFDFFCKHIIHKPKVKKQESPTKTQLVGLSTTSVV